MTDSDNKSDRSGSHKGWKRYFYSEEGLWLAFCASVALFLWYSELFGSGPSNDGFIHRKLGFMEPYLGKHYLPIIMSVGVVVIALQIWRKGGK